MSWTYRVLGAVLVFCIAAVAGCKRSPAVEDDTDSRLATDTALPGATGETGESDVSADTDSTGTDTAVSTDSETEGESTGTRTVTQSEPATATDSGTETTADAETETETDSATSSPPEMAFVISNNTSDIFYLNGYAPVSALRQGNAGDEPIMLFRDMCDWTCEDKAAINNDASTCCINVPIYPANHAHR